MICVEPFAKVQVKLPGELFVGCLYNAVPLDPNKVGEFDYHVAKNKCTSKVLVNGYSVGAPLCRYGRLRELFRRDGVNVDEMQLFISERLAFYDKELPVNRDRLGRGLTVIDISKYDEYLFLSGNDYSQESFLKAYKVTKHG